MEEQNIPLGDEQPSFLSLINTEFDKVHSLLAQPSSSTVETEPQNTTEEVQHLKSETFAELLIPIDWLSDKIQAYIRTVAEAYGCPQDYVTAFCLITAGIAAGKKVQLETNPYFNYPCDFLCVVGKPSSNKTSPLKEVTQPLKNRDKTNFEAYVREILAYDQQKQDDKHFYGSQPVFHQYVVGDSSPESRNALLSQGDLILISADELKSFIDSFGRYSKGGNGTGAELSQLLSIWSNISFTINRKSEETKLVEDPAMSIVGGIQPNPLAHTFGTDALIDSGFTQRFLFVFPNKTKFVKRCDRKKMTQQMRDYWNCTIERLFDMQPLTIQLSLEAEQLYADYADANDINADAEEDDYIGSVKQKMNIHVLRLAIMNHLLSDNWSEPVISDKEMEYVVRIADYFTRTHIERIYPLFSMNRQQVHKKLTKELVITEIGQAFPNIKNKSALAEALDYDRSKLTNILNGKLKNKDTVS